MAQDSKIIESFQTSSNFQMIRPSVSFHKYVICIWLLLKVQFYGNNEFLQILYNFFLIFRLWLRLAVKVICHYGDSDENGYMRGNGAFKM